MLNYSELLNNLISCPAVSNVRDCGSFCEFDIADSFGVADVDTFTISNEYGATLAGGSSVNIIAEITKGGFYA